MKTIYLIGFMGSGKSTIGSRLSTLLNKAYIDTDIYIENKYKQQITKIFHEKGEDVFRAYESDALNELPNGIVSTGGGIVERSININIMKASGIIVYLHTSFNEITNRLKHDQTRPLWKTNLASKKALFERRTELYENCADIVINTDNKLVNDIVNEIKLLIK